MGMNPSSYNTNSKDRKNHTFDRLKRWFDHAGVRYFSFVNCCDRVGQVNKRDIDYHTIKTCVTGYDRVIAIGNFSSDALSHINIPHLKLPHPSPRNRKFNDSSYEQTVIDDLIEYLER